MSKIFQAWYVCKSVVSSGLLPGYNNVQLGLPGSTSDIIIRGTCSRFVLGKQYYIEVSEIE